MGSEGPRTLGPGQAEAFGQASQGAVSREPAPQAGHQDGPEWLEHRVMQRLLQDAFCRAGAGRSGRPRRAGGRVPRRRGAVREGEG